MAFILLCLLIAIYFDARLLKRRDPRLFEEVFQIPAAGVILGLLFISAVLVFSRDMRGDLPALMLVILPPLYLIRRNRFNTTVKWAHARRSLRLLSVAMGVIVVWLYGIAVFGLLVSGIKELFPEAVSKMGDLVLSAAFSSVLIMGLIYQASKSFSDGGFLTNIGLRRGNRPRSKVILLPIVLGVFFAFCSSYLTVTRHVQPQTPLNKVIETTRSLDLILIFLFLAICIAPLFEEVVFRGYFFYVIKEWVGTKKAVFIIALTFAFLHVGQYWGDWLAIVMVALLGFTLTILRAWTGTTVASVIAHYVYNGSVTVIPVIIIAVSNPAYFKYKAYFPYHDARTKEALLKESIARQPDLADAYNDLAWLYAQEDKDLDTALELAERALGYDPQKSAYLDTKAEVLEKLGRYGEAKPIRERLKGKLP